METSLPNFHWIVEGLLAGMAQPGTSYHDPQEDIRTLSRMGFSVLVSLTEKPIPFDMVAGCGVAPIHIPIEDFGAPTIEQAQSFCELVDRMEQRQKKVAVHCYAGLGRTGTMAAAFLMHRLGLSAPEAIEHVRKINLGYVQSDSQEAFLFEWEKYIKK